jgi:putative ABC transport system permease protein
MIKNYFKNRLSQPVKHRVFSFINIMGLTVGPTAFFLIFYT